MANFSININKKISNVIIGEDVAKGDLLYLDSDNKWYKTTAGNKVKSTTELMMALSDGLEGEQIELLNYGYFEFDNSILIPGDKYYVSINNGKITNEVYDTDDYDYDYVIRYVGTAFTDKTLLFNPDQTYISDNRSKINEVRIGTSTGGSFVFQDDIVVALSNNKTFGKYLNGDTMPLSGMTFEEAIKDIAIETINPTFVNPSYSLSSSITGTKEVGEELNVDLTGNFNRGAINGKIVNGVWNPTTKQADRAGAPVEYRFEGSTNGASNTKTISNHKTVLGSNSFQSQVFYSEGPQPVNSIGDDFDTPLSPGNISATTSYSGALRRFFGAGTVTVNPRTLSSIFDSTSLSQTFDIVTGTTQRFFHLYIPDSRELEKVELVEASYADITSQYVSQGIVQVPDAAGDLHDYRYYKMEGAIPYNPSVTHRIKIKNA